MPVRDSASGGHAGDSTPTTATGSWPTSWWALTRFGQAQALLTRDRGLYRRYFKRLRIVRARLNDTLVGLSQDARSSPTQAARWHLTWVGIVAPNRPGAIANEQRQHASPARGPIAGRRRHREQLDDVLLEAAANDCCRSLRRSLGVKLTDWYPLKWARGPGRKDDPPERAADRRSGG